MNDSDVFMADQDGSNNAQGEDRYFVEVLALVLEVKFIVFCISDESIKHFHPPSQGYQQWNQE